MLRFSIITVTLNNVDNLVATYHSVTKQNHSLYEWLVIDGASTDGTVNFLRTRADSNLRWNSSKDSGLYEAMNKGINLAKGEFIIFLNAGDLFHSADLLTNLDALLRHHPTIDFIYGDSLEEDNQKKLLLRKSRNIARVEFGMFTHHQSMFYKREKVIENSLEYNLSYNIAADYDFTLKYLSKSDEQYHYSETPISVFMQGGISQQKWRKGISQATQIRKSFYGKKKLVRRTSTHLLQHVLHVVRFKFPFIYNAYRYKNSQKS